MRFETAIEDDAGQSRKALRGIGIHQREQDVGAIGRGDHHHALGESLEDVLRGHAADHHPKCFAVEEFRVAAVHLGAQRLLELGHRRREEHGQLRQTPARNVEFGQCGTDIVHVLGIAAVGDDGRGGRVHRGDLGAQVLGEVAHLGGCSVECLERQDDRSREVGRDACVVRELRRVADVGVVRSDDDDGVALRFDGVEARDDVGDGAARVCVYLVVGDADGFVVADVRRGVFEQEVEEVVTLAVSGPRDGSEHADPAAGCRQERQHTERHRRFSGLRFRGHDVDLRCAHSVGRHSGQRSWCHHRASRVRWPGQVTIARTIRPAICSSVRLLSGTSISE